MKTSRTTSHHTASLRFATLLALCFALGTPGATSYAAPRAQESQLIVEQSGFGQNEKSAGYAFIVKNPSADQAITRAEYQVAFYDEDDTIVETETGYINLILPGQSLGIGGTQYLDDGVTLKSIEVQVSDGSPEDFEAAEPFEVGAVTYWEDDFSPKATATITNPFAAELEDLYVSAVAYNEDDEIIGGGYTFLPFIPAAGSAAVEVSLVSSQSPARIDLYPAISALTMLGASAADEKRQPLELVAQGGGTSDGKLGYGFIVENPNKDLAIENSRYQIAAYDEDGRVLKTESGYLGLLLPGQTLGIGNGIYLPDDTEAVRFTTQLHTGRGTKSSVTSPFSTTKVSFKDDSFSPKVTGVLKSAHKKRISDVPVHAVAYDAEGNIIGGGFTYVNFVPPNGQAPVEVYVTVTGTPDKVELFPALSSLDQLK